VGVIVSAAVLLLGLTCFLLASVTGLGNGLKGLFAPTATPVPTAVYTTVPDFHNVQFVEAQSKAQAVHLSLQETLQSNPTVAKGVIFDQSPAAGAQEPYGFVVSVTVSDGPAKQKMPDETNKALSDALHDLASQGFTNIQQVPQVNVSVPPGVVFQTNPVAGTEITPDTQITLYYNSASPTATPTATATPSPSPTPTCVGGTPTPPATC
jgi:serine/threonine-protein kinase